METTENSFVSSMQKKKKRKRTRTIILLCVAAAVLAVAAVLFFGALNRGQETASALSYRAAGVSSGVISSTISGSGTLAALKSESVTAAARATVTGVNFQPGDAIAAGDVVLTLESEEISSQIDALSDELEETRTSLAGTKQLLTNLAVTAKKSGIVKDIRAAAGDLADRLDYLCLIATDGKMRLVLDAPEGLGLYDAVSVVVDSDEQDGYVTALANGKATIVFTDNYYPVGVVASAFGADGSPLGTGTIDVNEAVCVAADAGRIASVKVSDNQRVSKGATVFKLAEGAPNPAYTELKTTEADLVEQIGDLSAQLSITAEYDCVLTALSVSAGDTVAAGGALCTLSGTSGYTLSLSIDELDIASVALGQSAAITLDALEGESFGGTVTNISYSGSGSYVTSYTATVTTDPIEGAYPGMSASVEITTATSGETLIVSVAAVQYDGDAAYVWLAGDGVQMGESVDAAALDTDSLTRVSVTTGMSDGSYIAISGEGLAAGDLIWTPVLVTSATYSEDEENVISFNSFGGQQMNSFSGGGMAMPEGGNFGGGDFGAMRPDRGN